MRSAGRFSQWMLHSETMDENENETIELALLRYGVRKRFDFYEINVPYIMCIEGQLIRYRDVGVEIHVVLLSSGFNSEIPVEEFPSSVRVLMLGRRYNQPLDNLPDGIELIVFPEDGDFDRELNNLPVSVKGIILNKRYSRPLGLVPAGTKFLYVGGAAAAI
jgi:hypothetical protein